MPQTVPSAGYTPPFDYSSVFAADSFDLSLLPSPEATLNDAELPLSPSTLLYSPPSMFGQSSPQSQNQQQQNSTVDKQQPPQIYTSFYPNSPLESKDDLQNFGDEFKSYLTPPYSSYGGQNSPLLISTFKEEPNNIYLSPSYPISPPLSNYSNHSSPVYHPPKSVSPSILTSSPPTPTQIVVKNENTIDLNESLEEFKQLQQQMSRQQSKTPSQQIVPQQQTKDQSASDYQLLREVLRDTSFQKKYNLRPFDFGNITSGFVDIKMEKNENNNQQFINMNSQNHHDNTINNNADDVDDKDDVLMTTCCNNALDREKIEPVLSLAFEEMQKEVNNTCSVLGISSDPTLWTNEDVKAWLLWTCDQFNLPPVQIDYFNMDGQTLASLSKEEFTQRAHQGGGCDLHAQLEIWKAACLETEIVRASMNSPLNNSAIIETTTSTSSSTAAVSISQTTTTSVPILSPTSPPVPITINQINNQQTSSSTSNNSSCSLGQQQNVWPKPNSNQSSTTSSGDISDDDDEDSSMVVTPTATNVTTSTVATANKTVTTPGGKATTSRGATGGGSHIHLWQFLKELLASPTLYGTAIRWLDRGKGVFKIEDSVRVARLWGKRKNRPAMNYDKLSRSIRQYYKKGIMKKTERSQRLVYQFCHPYCL
ncbi:DNA-binding protein D-ETS-4-like isoform X2 [Chrysoperla carnea]|nr:DNA-binding protein D-ETS-4-like isoform X2 [Chrysoperla carnea]